MRCNSEKIWWTRVNIFPTSVFWRRFEHAYHSLACQLYVRSKCWLWINYNMKMLMYASTESDWVAVTMPNLYQLNLRNLKTNFVHYHDLSMLHSLQIPPTPLPTHTTTNRIYIRIKTWSFDSLLKMFLKMAPPQNQYFHPHRNKFVWLRLGGLSVVAIWWYRLDAWSDLALFLSKLKLHKFGLYCFI